MRFDDLRQANIRRLPQFKNSQGEPAHSEPDTKLCDVLGCSNRIAAELTGKCNECGADYIEGILDGRSVKNYELLMKKGRESDLPDD